MSATLDAARRDKLGTRASRKLRFQGRIPCSLVAEDNDPVALSIDEDQFLAARRAHEHLFDLDFGSESEAALVNELQWDTFTGRIQHVEFRRVVRGQKTESEVELTFKGNLKGGVLNHLVTHVTIESLPSQIPDGIDVSVDGMSEGSTIHAKDLVLPEGSALGMDPETVIAIISAVKVEAEASDDEEAAEEGAAE